MNNDLSAPDAAHILGISLATLYSYVSRGLLTPSMTQASRSKCYSHEAVLRLAARKADAKRGGNMAAGAMNWGLPVLETRISRIAGGRLYYRGHDALVLADGATLESVACLLWDDAQCDYFDGDAAALPKGLLERMRGLQQGMSALERALASLPLLAQSLPVKTADACAMFQSGPVLMRLLAAVLLEGELSALPLHRQVALAWGADEAEGELIRAALVLLADHELNASTFTVRCVASTGAGLAATLSAGLAALSGSRHGGGSACAKAMLDAVLSAPATAGGIAAYHVADDGTLAGYGHPLYPAGDPRAAYLLQRLSLRSSSNAKVSQILAICDEAASLQGSPPNADLALAALELAFGWPDSAGVILFALARSAGWIAHAAEQAATGTMIRPRARYVGRYHEK